MLGYYKEPELTARRFTADGWLHTGDKGALDAEGNLRITGRVKDLFKTSKGKYVAPAPIEDRLVMHDAIEACGVTGANLGQPLGIVMLNAEAAQRARTQAERRKRSRPRWRAPEAVNASSIRTSSSTAWSSSPSRGRSTTASSRRPSRSSATASKRSTARAMNAGSARTRRSSGPKLSGLPHARVAVSRA